MKTYHHDSARRIIKYCLILFPLSTFAQDHAPYIFQHYEQDAGREKLHIQGKAKLISEHVFKTTSKDGKIIKIDEKPEDTDSLWFDENGRKLKEETSGLEPYTEKHIYDSSGKETEFYLMRVETVREIIRHVRYKYDDKGRVILWDEHYGKAYSVESSLHQDKDSAMEHSMEIFKYDKKGNEIEVDEIALPYLDIHDDRPYGFDTVNYFSEYDSVGNKVKSYKQTSNNIYSLETCKYYKDHKLAERNNYGLFSSHLNRWKDAKEGYELENTESFKYDSAGNIIEKTITYPTKQTIREFQSGGQATDAYIWKYQYDSKGNLIRKEKYDSYNHLISYNSATYDDKSNITEEKYYVVNNLGEAPRQIAGYAYNLKYDKEGNWIKKTTVNALEDYIMVSERQIIYY